MCLACVEVVFTQEMNMGEFVWSVVWLVGWLVDCLMVWFSSEDIS